MKTEPGHRSPDWRDLAFFCLLALVIGYVLWLPVFPSGDGPAHLYFASVLDALIHRQPAYRSYYAVRHLVAPYALHYLALIGLEQYVTAAVAEKIFVSIILVNSALGCRFLARCLARASHAGGENVPVVSLWIIPLLITWALGAGFFNFCFAVGIMFWALGLWTLLPSAAALGGFIVTLALLVFSHPVPLLVLILLLAGDLTLLAWQRAGRRVLGWKSAAFVLALLAMLGPLSIADKGHAGAILPDVQAHWDILIAIVTGQNLGLISGTKPLQIAAQAGLVLIVPGAAWLVLRGAGRRMRGRQLTAADRLLLLALLFLSATWFFPRSLNGSFYFPQRMWDIVWPLVLATAAGAATTARLRRRLAAAAVVLIVLTFVVTVPVLTPVARKQALLGEASLPTGARGIYIEPDSVVNDWQAGTTYPLYYWAGVRAFEQRHAVLLNSPWMYLTILPVKQSKLPGGPRLFYDLLPSEDSEHPFALWQELRGSSRYRDEALAHASFILYANPLAKNPQPLDEMKPLLREQQPRWSCTAYGFYALCLKR